MHLVWRRKSFFSVHLYRSEALLNGGCVPITDLPNPLQSIKIGLITKPLSERQPSRKHNHISTRKLNTTANAPALKAFHCTMRKWTHTEFQDQDCMLHQKEYELWCESSSWDLFRNSNLFWVFWCSHVSRNMHISDALFV